MSVTVRDIEQTASATFILHYEMGELDAGGQLVVPTDLVGATAKFQVRETELSAAALLDADAVIDIATGVVSFVIAQINLPPILPANSAVGRYVYGAVMTYADGEKHGLSRGKFTLHSGVVR